MDEMYILYGVKDDQKFYVMNMNPLLWTSDITQSKIFKKRYYAEYELLRVYNNYHAVNDQLSKETLDAVYIALVDSNYNEIGRAKLL